MLGTWAALWRIGAEADGPPIPAPPPPPAGAGLMVSRMLLGADSPERYGLVSEAGLEAILCDECLAASRDWLNMGKAIAAITAAKPPTAAQRTKVYSRKRRRFGTRSGSALSTRSVTDSGQDSGWDMAWTSWVNCRRWRRISAQPAHSIRCRSTLSRWTSGNSPSI